MMVNMVNNIMLLYHQADIFVQRAIKMFSLTTQTAVFSR